MRLFPFIFLLLLLTATGMYGCSDEPERPDELIEEKTYINLMVELQLIRSYAETTSIDSLAADSLAQEVYTKYGVSGEQFRESHHYYQQFPREQKERVDEAIELLRMDQVEEDTVRRDTMRRDTAQNDTTQRDTTRDDTTQQ